MLRKIVTDREFVLQREGAEDVSEEGEEDEQEDDDAGEDDDDGGDDVGEVEDDAGEEDVEGDGDGEDVCLLPLASNTLKASHIVYSPCNISDVMPTVVYMLQQILAADIKRNVPP